MSDVMLDADLFPASFAQQRLWFLDQLIPEKALYNNLFALRMQGQLHVQVLEQAMQEIVNRHETLRTTFLMDDEEKQLMQVIVPEHSLAVVHIDLQGLPVAEREAQAMEHAAREARLPFDLQKGPLLRTSLLRISEDDHLLLFTIHHIISDGWSLGVLIQELVGLYQAFLAGTPSPFAELPIQYADYAYFQQEWLAGDVLDAQLAYWKEQLAGELPVLQLPSDRPRPAVITYRGSKQSFTLSKRLTERLVELSRTQGTTLFMTLLAAFQTLLYRYSGQEDVIVGSPIAGRNRAEIEGLIGFFVNTLVLRANLADAPTFAELLQQVRQVTLDAFANQEVPFEKLVEELQPERSQSHTPLFQVMFVLQNAPQSTLELPGLTMSLLDVEHGTSKYDLLLSMHETAAGLAGSLEYSTDLFEQETISRLLTHLELLLEQVVEHPNRAITDLQFLSQAEMEQLQQWSRTETVERPAVCVHQLFEAQVALTPDQVALVFDEERMTYADLNSRANQVARYLQELGVGPDVPVGLCVERSFDLVVGVLGILKAGGAYVSLDPAYPQERLAVIREEAGMSVVVTQDALRHLFGSEAQAVALDADGERIGQFAADNLTVDVTNDHLAYLLFTSGSTGRPKGVAMGHRPLVNLIAWQLEQFQTEKQARTMQFASLNFDVSFQEIFSTLCAGGTLCIPREEIRKDGERLLDFLARHQVERVFLPYIVLQHLSEVATKRADGALAIREIITAGEQLQMTPPIVQWVERLPGCVVHNQYGPTESHVATAQTLTGSPHTWPLLPSIGRPIANTEVCVLDTQMKRVPVGVPGELYIGGVSLARGYWQRPDLTKERFVPHPFRTGAEERLYKTGDLVRYLADGSLDYLGRIDGQVKVRGFRIELGEIEAVLAQHPDVTECVAVVREDVPGDKRLVAYVVADSSEQDMSIYRRWLQSRLPDYMLPSAFVKLEALPVTPNGKVDRRALPAPAATNVRRDEGPRTPEEAQVARIWSEVLRVDAIGREDNFFEIGGHSLLAAQVMTRISQTFGCDTPLRLLFEHSTLAELTEQVQRLKLGQEHEQATHLRPIPLEARGVLSFSQERALAVYHSSADKASRNMPCVLRMQGNLHVEALGRAIHEIIRRNEILRTAYVEQDGQTVQVVRPYPYQPMAVVDLSELSPQQQEEEVTRITVEDAKRPFDMQESPMIRFQLLRLGEMDHVLYVNIQHIAFDGWSISILVKELNALYRAFVCGNDSPLAELPIQYGEFAVWEREREKSGIWEQQLAYWKQQLGGPRQDIQLPVDHHTEELTGRGDSISFAFSPSLSERILARCRHEGVTLYMMLIAAYQTVLSRYTGVEDQRTATAAASRNRPELEEMIGFFTNALVLRNQISGELTISELLQRVRNVTLDGFANHEVPYARVLEALHSEEDKNQPPLFQAVIMVQNTPDTSFELPELSVSMHGVESGIAKFDILVTLEESDAGLAGSIVYSTDLYEASTIARLITNLELFFEQAAELPTCKIADIQLETATSHR